MRMAEYYVKSLNLIPHPEGGYFCETYRSSGILRKDALPEGYTTDHCFATSIYFLLEGLQISAFHRLCSDEIWHYHDGSPAIVYIISPGGVLDIQTLGLEITKGQRPQVVLPAGAWFAAEVIDKNSFILMGCTVAPGFEFDDFELADRNTLSSAFPRHSELIERLAVNRGK